MMIDHWLSLAGPSVFKPIWVTRFVVPKNGLQIEKHTKTVGNRGLYLYVVLFSIFGGAPGPDSMGATKKIVDIFTIKPGMKSSMKWWENPLHTDEANLPTGVKNKFTSAWHHRAERAERAILITGPWSWWNREFTSKHPKKRNPFSVSKASLKKYEPPKYTHLSSIYLGGKTSNISMGWIQI